MYRVEMNVCGGKAMSQYCHKCGNELTDDAVFCSKCGIKVSISADSEQNKFQLWLKDEKNKRMFIIGIVLFFVVGLGSYLFFSNMNESDYLKNYGEASRTLSETHAFLTTSVTMDNVKEENVGQLKEHLSQSKEELDSLADKFSHMKPFPKYEKQHKSMLEILQKESSVIDSTIAICLNPIAPENDALLENIKADTEAIKSLSADISVPDVTLATGSDITVLYLHLQSIVAEQRKFNKEKMDKLEAMNQFFNAMDDALQKYDSSKTDMYAMLQTVKNGGMIWRDYFNQLDKAKNSRTGVKSAVVKITAPAGTEALRSELIGVLDDSIRYCELMRIAANLEFNRYYSDAIKQEKRAAEMNDSIQTSYEAFLEKYHSEKS